MRKSIIALAVAGSVAVGGAALAGPALAESAAPATTTTAATALSATPAPSGGAADRPSPQARITGALEGLVTDGTITQDQSDAVATTLAEQLARGGHDGSDGFGRAAFGQIAAAAAEALGVSEADLRTELQGGRSVADVAQERGVDLGAVTMAVTDAAQAQIAQAVTDGRLTQARADALTADLDAKITEELSETRDGDHDGPGWRGGRGGPFGGPDAGSSTPAPSEAAPTS